jgi:hypothetical protein
VVITLVERLAIFVQHVAPWAILVAPLANLAALLSDVRGPDLVYLRPLMQSGANRCKFNVTTVGTPSWRPGPKEIRT